MAGRTPHVSFNAGMANDVCSYMVIHMTQVSMMSGSTSWSCFNARERGCISQAACCSGQASVNLH